MSNRRLARWWPIALFVTGATLLAACTGSGSSSQPPANSSSKPVNGGSVTYAVPFAQSWMLPIWNVGTGIANYDTLQSWLPLYWFGDNGHAQVNYALSVGKPPVYSNGGKTVTISLNPQYKWSNGTPVTTRDIQFYINVLTASDKKYPQNWIGYSASGFPFNVTSIDYISPTKFSITFNQAYNQYWLLYNELSQIYPFPTYAWDKTSQSGPVGNYDKTPAGALNVINFLNSRSKDLAGWNTDPLWQAVDGPYKLKSFQPTTGVQTFVRNKQYAGVNPGHVDSYTLQPFTSDQAEVSALLAGNTVTYGYLPLTDLQVAGRLKSMGYTIDSWPIFGFAQLPLNLTNPKVGPIFQQLYIRQAMQHLIDQNTLVKTAFHGYAVPTYGPVPTAVPNPFADSFEKTNPYPYGPAAARQLLTSHGWTVPSGGVATCTKPGTGAGECGKGISQGAKLSFNMLYASGKPTVAQEVAALHTDFALAGIQLNLQSAPIDTLFSTEVACDTKTGANCKWQMIDTGQGWVYSAPQFAPTGESLFLTGAGSNAYSYSDPKADALIRATQTTNGLGAMDAYENYMAQQLPTLWLPWQVNQVSVISNKLHGALPQDPYQQFYPQFWWLSQ
jgi:peptide/nickel transport system substrate-binding protein